MQMFHSAQTIHRQIEEKKRLHKKIAFVPTMGALHEGHLSLVKIAKRLADVVIVSIYVNPTQFAPNEDLDKYPRTLESDKEKLTELNVDYLFLPTSEEMYPNDFSTYVREEKLSKFLCGKSRPTHFQGVTTIVAKLFNIIQPDYAIFGQKDYQQYLIIKKMVRELNFNIEIIRGDIVREEDGLAMSSRNAYLTEEERKQAPILYKSLIKAKDMLENGEKDVNIVKNSILSMIQSQPKAQIDYVEIVDANTLQPITEVVKPTLIALAVKFGQTRLIDNILFE